MKLAARRKLEKFLFDSNVGSQVLDAMVQANLDVGSLPLDELKRITAQFSVPSARRRSRFGGWDGERQPRQPRGTKACSGAANRRGG